MKIKIEKTPRGNYVADCLEMPGSPPSGHGTSKKSAVANLLTLLFFSTHNRELTRLYDQDKLYPITFVKA
jgi:hypothetical protein